VCSSFHKQWIRIDPLQFLPGLTSALSLGAQKGEITPLIYGSDQQIFSNPDPNSSTPSGIAAITNPDPDPDLIRIQGFNDQKLKKKNYS
jgi:hypothetical protein